MKQLSTKIGNARHYQVKPFQGIYQIPTFIRTNYRTVTSAIYDQDFSSILQS